MTSDTPTPTANLPALPPRPIPPDLVKEMAMDIGKEVAAYIERMYPKAVKATSSTFLLSVRNSIYNEIIAAIGTSDADEIAARLADRKVARRRLRALWKRARGIKLGQVDEAMNLSRHGAGMAEDL